MLSAAVTRLKAELSEFLRRVKAGDELLVTERGKPIARLIPYRASATDDASLVRMEREGIVRVGHGPFPEDPLSEGPRVRPSTSVVAALLEERDGSH